MRTNKYIIKYTVPKILGDTEFTHTVELVVKDSHSGKHFLDTFIRVAMDAVKVGHGLTIKPSDISFQGIFLVDQKSHSDSNLNPKELEGELYKLMLRILSSVKTTN